MVSQYPGIEGFYFLTTQGGLGYITTDGQSYIKETFPQIDNPDFLAQHPGFVEELSRFTHDLNLLKVSYLDSHEPDIELGHVRPTGEGEFQWQSATLVLQKDVQDTLRAYFDLLITKGIRDPSEASADSESMQEIRGIHHGMDDLVNYQDELELHQYFPVLFYWPRSMRAGVGGLSPDVETAPMRVLNLMWRPAAGAQDDAGTAQGFARCASVFAVLRNNLQDHGAIDRNRRVEHRFSID
jgi:hypothetical protein